MSSVVILPETAAILQALAEQEGPALYEMTAPDMRSVYRQLGEIFDLPSEAGVRTLDFIGAGIPMRSYDPGVTKPGPVIVYMHGGGWVIGDLETHDSLCVQFAKLTGLRVVAVDYRLAPEAIFPAAHDDCAKAVEYVLSSPPELGQAVQGVALAGDSAGGNLAFSTTVRMGDPRILAQLLFYPVGDCTGANTASYESFREGYLLDKPLMDRFIGDYLPTADLRADPRVSPLLGELPSKLPPTIILTAGLDPLRDEGRMLAGRIAATGNEVHFAEAEGLIHGIATMRKVFPTGDRMLRQIIGQFSELITKRTNKSQEREA
jgi:acetyl esterase